MRSTRLLTAAGTLALAALLAACAHPQPMAETGRVAADRLPGTTGRPRTIPALRAWVPANGEFWLDKASRLLVASGDREALCDTAAVFVEDLQALTGIRLAIVDDSSGQSRPGDILLRTGPADSELGTEGYELNVGSFIVITAPEAAGVFYGTRTLLQLFHQSRKVHAGRARDWPRYPERGMMVDNGRKYFTARWFARQIRDLAYLKMNYLHLHFSENEGFGIESERHPEIVSKRHLSKPEVRSLLDLARRYHITVVPEIDMPGHMGAALAPHPRFQLVNGFGIANAHVLDVTNPEAVAFALDLIQEYLDLFPGLYWHGGADEVLSAAAYPFYPKLERYAQQRYYDPHANGKDAIHGFVNTIDEFVRSRGRTLRVWNDDLGGGSKVAIRSDMIVEWWTDFSALSDWFPPRPQQLLDAGHQIMNCGWWPTYYVPGAPFPPKPNMASAYGQWVVNNFYGPLYLNSTAQVAPYTISADDPRNRGAKLQVWTDDPDAETEDQIAASISGRLRVIAQKTWESQPLIQSYQEFLLIIEAVGDAPCFEVHAR